jgi:flavin-dependent dehydrogenase
MQERTAQQADVVILGGGLAGLTLALQLRQRFADLDVLVLERRRHPVPEAAHKVGESCVEIASHYFENVLGLKEHLESRQLPKFGFRFFFSENRRRIEDALEIGVSTSLATPTFQIDRGIFENFLGQRARERGIRFVDGATVRSLSIARGGDRHRATVESDGQVFDVESRWLIDASGRAGLIKRELGLAEEIDHDVNSAWFRIGTRIDVNDWSSDASWLGRCTPPDRWRSTNHLVGEGYWVWLIPLASGSHSVGIVADGRVHPLSRINTFNRALAWLKEFQPLLAADVEAKRSLLQDFLFLKHFSHGCRKVFSGDRWALTGESGVFLDPFYSRN